MHCVCIAELPLSRLNYSLAFYQFNNSAGRHIPITMTGQMLYNIIGVSLIALCAKLGTLAACVQHDNHVCLEYVEVFWAGCIEQY